MKHVGRSVGGYVSTLLGVIFLVTTLAIFGESTSLRGAPKVASASAAGLVSGVALLTGFRLLREDAGT